MNSTNFTDQAMDKMFHQTQQKNSSYRALVLITTSRLYLEVQRVNSDRFLIVFLNCFKQCLNCYLNRISEAMPPCKSYFLISLWSLYGKI